MSIDRDTARRVANLARIDVPEGEIDGLADELSGIITFMQALRDVNVDGVPAMTSVTPMEFKRRDDEVTDGNFSEKVLSNAPDCREGYFVVPKVVE
ncbi:MAG: Asp-tRNA(Asn)/Glu-tRNA(Gln) amidotransferase subunit GatC [Paracoccaceae bacterium]|nr:Asp-tRNA(Asn)/Glu-tRNA(Gln) amidotransferase subunit GatC [Paracoccaceae bacterium]MDE2915305.1 Asp-tRNA(Asn)/Glu-tRNA(Gln) amidotransferase subunit GatC [Paracoccaceae bacterium]